MGCGAGEMMGDGEAMLGEGAKAGDGEGEKGAGEGPYGDGEGKGEGLGLGLGLGELQAGGRGRQGRGGRVALARLRTSMCAVPPRGQATIPAGDTLLAGNGTSSPQIHAQQQATH